MPPGTGVVAWTPPPRRTYARGDNLTTKRGTRQFNGRPAAAARAHSRPDSPGVAKKFQRGVFRCVPRGLRLRDKREEFGGKVKDGGDRIGRLPAEGGGARGNVDEHQREVEAEREVQAAPGERDV